MDQIQQYRHSHHWHRRVRLCYYRCSTCDGNIKCILARIEASLGGVPEQVLRGRWIQVRPILIRTAYR